jgi:hypothetical protein
VTLVVEADIDLRESELPVLLLPLCTSSDVHLIVAGD